MLKNLENKAAFEFDTFFIYQTRLIQNFRLRGYFPKFKTIPRQKKLHISLAEEDLDYLARTLTKVIRLVRS
jgi:hypothetical protein